MKDKLKSKNEFRYNYYTKHTNYIFEETDKNYHSLGLTTKKITRDKNKKWHSNMPLDNNPKKNDNRKSYIRYGYISQNKNTFGKIDRRFAFSHKDKLNVKSKIRYFKKKRKKRH